MAIIFPSPTIARRWNGALQARLMRAPLEAFLRSHGRVPARTGVAQDTDDVTRAAVQLIETTFAMMSAARPPCGQFCDNAIVGHLACIVAQSLARLIDRPGVWRIAALLSTAQLLSPWMSLTEAAVASAGCIRRFEREGAGISAMDEQLAQAAISAVTNDCAADFAKVSANIVSCLSGSSPGSSIDSVAQAEASAR